MAALGVITEYSDCNLLLYTARSPLSFFVNHIWYAKPCHASSKTVQRFLPNGSMDLIFNLGDEPERILGHRSNEQSLNQSWITGLHAKYLRIETPPGLCMMGVEFKPGGAYPFFGFPMSELRESSVELDLILGRDAFDIRNAILESKSDQEKFLLVENFLLSKLSPSFQIPPVISKAIQLISRSDNIFKIRDLSEHLGLIHKNLICQFEAVVGITPKTFSRICRFQRSLQKIPRYGPVELTDVAISCDYYDQAHFIKEFKEFSGLRPSEYLQVRGDFPGWVPESLLVNNGRNFLQSKDYDRRLESR